MRPRRQTFPKISVNLGPLLPMVEEYVLLESKKKLLPPDRSTVIRECLEQGLMSRISKLPESDRARILKAGASTAA